MSAVGSAAHGKPRCASLASAPEATRLPRRRHPPRKCRPRKPGIAVLRLVAQQFRRPHGLLGHLWGWLMDRANGREIASSVEALSVEPHHRVLEIGFGGGLGLQLLLASAREGTVTGTDLSEVLRSRAERRFAGPIREGRLRLVAAAVERLPFDDLSFDRVVSVNTVYFWSAPEQGLAELFRVLERGGRVVVSMRRPELMRRLPFTRYGFTLYEPWQLQEMMEAAGFAATAYTTHEDDWPGYVCVTGQKTT